MITFYTPIEVAIAISLYNYNVSPQERAAKLYEHFKGNCAEIHELIHMLTYVASALITELPYPTAKVYVDHALERYGDEAKERAHLNEKAYDMD